MKEPTPNLIQAQIVAARRMQLLQAAIQVFSEKGFHKATVKEIASAAGVADGTLYNYFKNKDDLLIGILDLMNESDRREDDFAQELATEDFRQFMATYLAQRIALLWPNAKIFQAILPEILVNPDLRSRYYEELIAPSLQIAEEYYGRQIAAGKIRNLNVPLTVRATAATLLGLLVLRLLGDPEIVEQADALPDVLATIICDGLLPSEEQNHDRHP